MEVQPEGERRPVATCAPQLGWQVLRLRHSISRICLRAATSSGRKPGDVLVLSRNVVASPGVLEGR